MKAPKYVIAPEGCADYLTPGKRYEVLDWKPDHVRGAVVEITNDNGKTFFSFLKDSPSLKGKDWIIPDDEADDAPDADGIVSLAQIDAAEISPRTDRRFVAACHAMQGVISSGAEPNIKWCIAQADALLAALKGKDAFAARKEK